MSALVDSGWIAVAGAVVGGSLTGAIALIQARAQHRFDTSKMQEDRRWNDQVTAKERDHVEMTKRREELVEIYTRYQLAADRLENALRELAEAGPARTHDDSTLEAFEAAQQEYDRVCEHIKLLAPLNTVKATLQQRQLFNRFAVEALNDAYDHRANYQAIVDAADPVLTAMREDLGSPE